MADKAKPMKIVMQGDGKMEWTFPDDGNLQRGQAYEVLGMLQYAKEVLLDMLKQPAKEKDAK